MHPAITISGQTAILRPDGSFAAATVTVLRGELLQAIDSGVKELSVDLSMCAMIDSSGLGLLIAAHNSLKKIGGTLKVHGTNPEIRKLFQIMRLDQHFPVA